MGTSEGQDKEYDDMVMGSNHVISEDKFYLMPKMTYDLALRKIGI
jgi:hypothetical protein